MCVCSGKKEEAVEIEDKNFSSMLIIQKVKDDGTSSAEMSKMMNNKHKIKQILTMIEGMEVVETDKDEMIDALCLKTLILLVLLKVISLNPPHRFLTHLQF